jgi:hypothetical protein
MKHAHESQRGQTIPFWAVGSVTVLVAMMFLLNFTDTIRWHIRAQNAADTAATAALAADADQNNQITMAQYTLAIDEYRIRSISQSMINGANGQGGCVPTQDDTGFDCDNAYDQEPDVYDAAVNDYATTLAQLQKIYAAPGPSPIPLPTPSGQPQQSYPQAPAGSAAVAAFSMVASDNFCWDNPGSAAPHAFDCAFQYNANGNFMQTGLGSTHYVDIVTCRKVNVNVPGFLHLGSHTQFQAVGRAAATLAPVTETFNPGTQQNPDVPGTPYQPIESCPAVQTAGKGVSCGYTDGWLATAPYVTDFSGLNVTATFFVPVPTKPTNPLGAYGCKAAS